jgi:GntR family transcriptional regulator/MocR family aminotransferase
MRRSTAIWLDRNSSQSLQNQLALRVKDLIQQGQLCSGEAVPSSRELANFLKVSRNTVVYAYDRLISEGYLEARERSGLFVSSSIAAISARQSATNAHFGAVSRKLRVTQHEKLGLPLPFRPCQPDVTLFPIRIWNRLRNQAFRSEGQHLLHYQESCRLGLPALREVLASYLREYRGVRCDWRQIAITAGSQQALFLLSRLLLRRGSRVYMEDPGYPGAQMAWKEAGAAVDAAPLDESGMKLPENKHRRYVLIYTTPSRQFPVGMCLTLARRLALLEYAEKTRAWVVEDDYDSEFRYSAPPLPSLQSLDRADRVVYVGTFSKVLCPSLRLGYVVLPPELVDDFERLRSLIDDYGPLPDQATLAIFLESGAFYSHIRRCRRIYAERQHAFLGVVSRKGLPFKFKYTDGGMNLAAFLEPGSNDKRWSAHCSAIGLDVPPISRYAQQPTPPGLVFGFTAFAPKQIEQALELLSTSSRTKRVS